MQQLLDAAREKERLGDLDEALDMYERAFALSYTSGDGQRSAEILRWIGSVRRERGHLELAEEAYEASLAVAEAHDQPRNVAAAINCLAVLEQVRGDIPRAEALYHRARGIAEQVQDGQLAAMVDHNLGMLANIRGQPSEALEFYGAALTRYRAMGDDQTASRALSNMGMAHVDLEQWQEAEGCFTDAYALAESHGDVLMLGTVEMNRAEYHFQRRQLPTARKYCEHSLSIFNRLRSKPGIAEAYRFLGVLFRESGDADRAHSHFAMALGLAESSEDRLLQAETQIEWALLHLSERRPEQGIRYLNRALRLFSEMQARREVLDIQRRVEKAEGLYLPSVAAWVEEWVAKGDPARAGHGVRVAELSGRIATRLGLDGWDRTTLHVGALVHDIGNAMLPPERQEPLRGELERTAPGMLHTTAGWAMVSDLDFHQQVQAIARHHHERWDGRGYPDGLSGEDIPLAVRIVTLADVYDSLVHQGDHPGMSAMSALPAVEAEAGGRLDPELCVLLREIVSADEQLVSAA